MGVSGGFGRGRIGYIGRNNNSSVAKDLLGAAGMGAKSFQAGHNSNLIDIAIEAVKGNVGTDNTPVEGIMVSEDVKSTPIQRPTFAGGWGSRDSLGVYIMKDSLSDGKVSYWKLDLNSDKREISDSVS